MNKKYFKVSYLEYIKKFEMQYQYQKQHFLGNAIERAKL